MLTAAVVVVIAALFFIPEIINFQKGIVGTKKVAERTVTPKPIVEVVDPSDAIEKVTPPLSAVREPKAKTPSLVDRIFAYFSSSRGMSPVEIRRQQELSGRDATFDKGRAVKAGAANVVGEEGITWKALKSTESVLALRKAHDDSVILAKSLPTRFSESIFALFNYASGIKYVLGGAEKSMDAQRAYRFLEELDATVSRTLLSERVPSSDYNSWTRISLGSVFANSRVIRSKATLQRPFNPNLRLVAVRIAQVGTRRKYFNEKAKAVLHLIASVEGSDIARVQAFRNGDPFPDRKLRHADRAGRRMFVLRGVEGRGIFVFRVTSKTGQIYMKAYNFYAQARKFQWDPRRDGRFVIPFGSGDPRLDSLFAIDSTPNREGNGITFFTSRVGNDVGKF